MIGVIIVFVLVIGIVGFFFIKNYTNELQKVKVNSLDIINVYRDCTKNADGNYRDKTIQTTVNFDVTNNKKYSLKLGTDSSDCTLRIGPNNIGGFYMGKIPTDPNRNGVDESGAYMIVGGELSGDVSDVLTFCCQEKCDTANIELCK